MTCNDLGPRIAGLVQQMHSVHTLFEQGKMREANRALADVQSAAQVVSHDLWATYYESGVGKV